jgi:hypothetical protein
MKALITLLILFLKINSYAQNLNLRKAILKSDLIIVCNDFTSNTISTNDFINISYAKINKIDSVLKNKLSAIPKNFIVRKYKDNEDYYSDLTTNEGGCVMRTKSDDERASYNTIFFIKKNGKEYQSFLILQGLEWSDYKNYTNQIRTIAKIEHLKNVNERFEKALDWFIENGLIPDDDFIEYYKQKGVTTDTIQYSELQYKNALQQFQNGKEGLFTIVKEKYFDETKQYFIEKMEALLIKDEPKFDDYFSFYEAFSALNDDFDSNPESVNYILKSALTSDKFDNYEKRIVMKHLINVAKEWKLK